MSRIPKQKGGRKVLLTFAIVSIIVLAGGMIYYFQGYQTKAIPDTSTSDSLFNSTLHLQLILSMSNSTIIYGQNETIQVQVYNALNSMNSIRPDENFPTFASGYRISPGPCSEMPYGFAVIQGNYDMSDLGAATPLELYQPGIYSCPVEFSVSQYQFFGHDTEARIYSNNSASQQPGLTDFNYVLNLSGYWSSGPQYSGFRTFETGVYTVVAADGWGEAVLLHFYVAPEAQAVHG